MVLPHTGPVEPAADSVGEQIQSAAVRRRRARRPRVAGPSDQALNWLAGCYAIALRLGWPATPKPSRELPPQANRPQAGAGRMAGRRGVISSRAVAQPACPIEAIRS